MSEAQRQLHASDPSDAVEIINQLVGKLRMDGLHGQEVAALFASIKTLQQHVAPSEQK